MRDCLVGFEVVAASKGASFVNGAGVSTVGTSVDEVVDVVAVAVEREEVALASVPRRLGTFQAVVGSCSQSHSMEYCVPFRASLDC